VRGYRAVRYEISPGCTAGYMPELNVLCGIADSSTQSEQPVDRFDVRRRAEHREWHGPAFVSSRTISYAPA
jgi:hypothetical protein